MSHAKYEVKWNPERKKWELLEERYGHSYYVLERYRVKQDAKSRAIHLAKKDRVKAGFYSKDPRGKERRTATRDYS